MAFLESDAACSCALASSALAIAAASSSSALISAYLARTQYAFATAAALILVAEPLALHRVPYSLFVHFVEASWNVPSALLVASLAVSTAVEATELFSRTVVSADANYAAFSSASSLVFQAINYSTNSAAASL